ncbi:MAG: G-protein coupled receptor, partial [Chromatiales bacterium]
MDGMENLQAEVFCRLWGTQFLPWGLMVSSSYNLMAISVERYLAIVHPIWHMNHFTDFKTRVSIVLIWLFGVMYVGAVIIPTSGVINRTCIRAVFWPSRAIAVVVGILELFVTLVIPFITHGLCYARIIVTLRNRCPHEERCMTLSSTDTEMATTQEQTNANKQPTIDIGSHTPITFQDGGKELFARKESASRERASNTSLQTISSSINTRE